MKSLTIMISKYYVCSYEDDFLKYCKISNIKLTKAKGYAIFATPSNIGGSFTNDFSADPYRDIYLYYGLPEQYKDYSEVEYSYSSDFDYSFLRHNELFNLF